MKRLSILIICFATLAFASCSSTMGSGTASSAAKDNGRAAGASIISLYNSYRSTGTVNLGNAADLTAALGLATAYTNFRNNQADPNYKKAFAAGMVSAGAGLITTANVNNLINTMNTYMQEETALRAYYNGRSVSANEIFLPVPLDEIDNSNGLYKQY